MSNDFIKASGDFESVVSENPNINCEENDLLSEIENAYDWPTPKADITNDTNEELIKAAESQLYKKIAGDGNNYRGTSREDILSEVTNVLQMQLSYNENCHYYLLTTADPTAISSEKATEFVEKKLKEYGTHSKNIYSKDFSSTDMANQILTKIQNNPTSYKPPEESENAILQKETGCKIMKTSEILSSKENLQPLVGNVFFEGDTLLIIGDAKAGKTSLALSLLDAIATGSKWCEMTVAQKKTLYIDFEMGAIQMKKRIKELKISEMDFCFPTGCINLFSTDGKNIFERLFTRLKPQVVVVDTLSHTHSPAQDENHSGFVTSLFGTINEWKRKFGISFIILHHMRKQYANQRVYGQDLIRGSSAIATQCDSAISIQKYKDKTKITNILNRNAAAKDHFYNFVLDDTGQICFTPIEKAPEKEKDRILKILLESDKPLRVSDIAEKLSLTVEATRSKINKSIISHKGAGTEICYETKRPADGKSKKCAHYYIKKT